MKKTIGYTVAIALTAFLFSTEESEAVTKVTRMVNVVEFFGGGSIPVGTRNGLPDYDFAVGSTSFDVNSSDIYDDGFHMGFNYGQLRNAHWLLSLGFRYTKHNIKDTIPLGTTAIVTVDSSVSYNQYDFDFNANYYVSDLMKASFSPYAGVSVKGGLTRISQTGYSDDHLANIALAVNFGADIRIWSSADARQFVTLSSVNSYDLFGSNDRPLYFNVGGAIKYYFRP